MVPCPNCGIDNAESRLFCAVCGTQLREEQPPPEPTPPPPTPTNSLFPDWLTAPGTQPPASTAKKSALPSWLQGAETELPPAPSPRVDPPAAEPAPPPAETASPPAVSLDSLEARTRVELPPATPPRAEPPPANTRSTILPTPTGKPDTWDDRLDFSDLPDWDVEETDTASPFAEPIAPKEPPMGSVETQGLLAGVTGAIPIEPIIRHSRRTPPPAPAMVAEPLTAETDEAAALFAQIAGGAVRPDPITVPRSAAVGSGILHLLLLLAVVGGLVLKATGWELFNPPTPAPITQAFGETLSALPRNGTVFVAVDYDGAVLDELHPALVATFNQIRTTAPEGRVVVASSSPVGVPLLFDAWHDSMETIGGKTEWQSSGYVTGGSTGQRTILARTPADVTVVVGGDSTAAQRWIEQATALAPDRPLLAIVPASAEVMLHPYLASGQVDGALTSLTESAAYELSQNADGGTAWQRLDTVTMAALVVVLAMVVGLVRR